MPMVLNIPGAILTPMPYYIEARDWTGGDWSRLSRDVRDNREARRIYTVFRSVSDIEMRIVHVLKNGCIEVVE